MKNSVVLILVLLVIVAVLYAGLNGLTKDHAYGMVFSFVGAITTIGLGMDVVNHLKVRIRKNNVRKPGRS